MVILESKITVIKIKLLRKCKQKINRLVLTQETFKTFTKHFDVPQKNRKNIHASIFSHQFF